MMIQGRAQNSQHAPNVRDQNNEMIEDGKVGGMKKVLVFGVIAVDGGVGVGAEPTQQARRSENRTAD